MTLDALLQQSESVEPGDLVQEFCERNLSLKLAIAKTANRLLKSREIELRLSEPELYDVRDQRMATPRDVEETDKVCRIVWVVE